jgi:hypothetical protein
VYVRRECSVDKSAGLNMKRPLAGPRRELVNRLGGTPPFSRMCGKQRTLSPMILEVWQVKELRVCFSEVWQRKGLAEVIERAQHSEPVRERIRAGQPRRADCNA